MSQNKNKQYQLKVQKLKQLVEQYKQMEGAKPDTIDKFIHYLHTVEKLRKDDFDLHPRFDVFYTKHQFGQHLFKTKYNQTLDESIQPFVTINYNRLADSEFANNPNVYYLYPKENCEDPQIILVLKNEYHDYYDQLK